MAAVGILLVLVVLNAAITGWLLSQHVMMRSVIKRLGNDVKHLARDTEEYDG